MTDIERMFSQIPVGMALAKLKVEDCPMGVYYGRSESGNLRFAFLTENPPIVIESTAHLKVTQWAEGANIYWTCFELLADHAKQVFFVLFNNLVKSAVGCQSEEIAMSAVKNRFMTWKKLFNNPSAQMTEELYKGLFGELYFLKNYMMAHHDSTVAVNAWSGPNKTAKDFSVSSDWYEIKTVSTNSETVKISSVTQLDSEDLGHLVLVKTEKMSNGFDNRECSVGQLMTLILNSITDESVKDEFIKKVIQYGYDVDGDHSSFHKYRVLKMNFYSVDNDFPKITADKVPYSEIVRVTYELSISSIEKYLEGEK